MVNCKECDREVAFLNGFTKMGKVFQHTQMLLNGQEKR